MPQAGNPAMPRHRNWPQTLARGLGSLFYILAIASVIIHAFVAWYGSTLGYGPWLYVAQAFGVSALFAVIGLLLRIVASR
jgi:hypothetical protein